MADIIVPIRLDSESAKREFTELEEKAKGAARNVSSEIQQVQLQMTAAAAGAGGVTGGAGAVGAAGGGRFEVGGIGAAETAGAFAGTEQSRAFQAQQLAADFKLGGVRLGDVGSAIFGETASKLGALRTAEQQTVSIAQDLGRVGIRLSDEDLAAIFEGLARPLQREAAAGEDARDRLQTMESLANLANEVVGGQSAQSIDSAIEK